MPNGKILRVPSGTKLSPQLLNSLKNLFPGDFTIEQFGETPDYIKSFEQRGKSLHAALLFALDSYPSDAQKSQSKEETDGQKQGVKASAAEWFEKYNNTVKAIKSLNAASELAAQGFTDEYFKQLNANLKLLTEELVKLVMHNWPSLTKKQAIDCLNSAEYYLLMQKGRQDLMTLTPGNNGEFTLQADLVEPAHYPQLIDELKQIKENGFPQNSNLFRQLPLYQKAYLCNLAPEIKTAKQILDELGDFLNFYKTKLNPHDWQEIVNEHYPTWFKDSSSQLQQMLKLLAKDPASIEQHIQVFKDKISELNAKEEEFNTAIRQVNGIPEWYWELPSYEQYYLEHVLKHAVKVEDTVTCLSSRHRTIPAPANFAKHRLYHINAKAEFTLLGSDRVRSSHIISRDLFDSPRSVQLRHGQSNLSRVTAGAKKDALIFIGTNVSPVPEVTESLRDKTLDTLKNEVVKLSENAGRIFTTNHPFNVAKFFLYTQSNDPNCLAFRNKVSTKVGKYPQAQPLLEQYDKLLNSGFGTATIYDYRGRELFLASLEHLMIMSIEGYSYGSCVSGKDRKAVELIHTDSMLLFKQKYGYWPSIDDDESKRNNFVTLFTDIYCSRHQHEHAGQNAPGSEGIKHTAQYLPSDIYTAINRKFSLQFDDKLASNNELDSIMNMQVSHESSKAVKCLHKAIALGKKNCTQMYDALQLLMNQQQNLKKSQTFYNRQPPSLATGITAIKAIMESKDNLDVTARMAKIFEVVMNRPESNSGRALVTQLIYGRIREVMNAEKEKLQGAVDITVSQWAGCFEKEKQSFSKSASTGDLVQTERASALDDFNMN